MICVGCNACCTHQLKGSSAGSDAATPSTPIPGQGLSYPKELEHSLTHESAPLVDFFVPGAPHSQKPWVSRVIDAAIGQPRISSACELDVEFVLPRDRVPWILPSETSLSNMLRVLLEALEDTVLREAPEGEGSLVAIRARAKLAGANQEPGTHILLRRAGAEP